MDEARRNISKFNSIPSVQCEYNHIQYRQWQVGEFYSGIRMPASPCQYCAHFYICNSLFAFHIACVNWMCYFCSSLCESCPEDGDWSPKHVENRNKHTWKGIVREVGYLQRLYRNAHSIEHKTGFFFENRLHRQCEVRLLLFTYVLASKPFDQAWFEVLETITLYCTWSDNR
jgi:hypothetical protein